MKSELVVGLGRNKQKVRNQIDKKHPMELEPYSQQEIIARLSGLQAALEKGDEVNPVKLEKNMMGQASFEQSKRNHEIL